MHFIVTKYLNSYLVYLPFTEDESLLTKDREKPLSNLGTRAFVSYAQLYVRSGCSGWWPTHAQFLEVLAYWAPHHILLSMASLPWSRAGADPLFFIFFSSRSCPTSVLSRHHTPSYMGGQTDSDAPLRSGMLWIIWIESSLWMRIRAILLSSWTSAPSVNFFFGSHINFHMSVRHSYLPIQQEMVPMTGGALMA